ncbi:hypothetical protein D3C80_1284170 [compost metagenome]
MQPGPFAIAPAHLQVVLAIRRLDPQVADVADVDVRVLAAEVGQPRGQPVLQERQAAAHLHRPALVLTEDLVGAHRQAADRILHHRQVGLPLFGQAQAPGQALEQGHAQVVFELPDLLAHRPLGEVQLLGCVSKVQGACRHFERPQPVERRQGFLLHRHDLVHSGVRAS